MSWIVDGHNLIPEIPGMSLSMPDDEEQLIKLLVNFVRATRKQLIVYFDNAPPGVDKHRRFGLVSAYFVREGRSADTAIQGKLRQLGKSARNWTVVSSDREVQLDARSVGASAISSKEFARVIFSAVNEMGKGSDVTQEEYPDDTEVEQWLELFSGEMDQDR